MMLVWSRRAITESSHTRRGRRELEEPVNLYSLQLPHDLQQFLFFIGYDYRPCLTSLFSIGYSSCPCVACSPLATCPSPILWADISTIIR